MTAYDYLYHTDPADCDYTERAHRFEPATGLCYGHAILPPPAPCRCNNADDPADPDGRCPNPVQDRDEAPYCPDCYTTRVFGIGRAGCTHAYPEP